MSSVSKPKSRLGCNSASQKLRGVLSLNSFDVGYISKKRTFNVNLASLLGLAMHFLFRIAFVLHLLLAVELKTPLEEAGPPLSHTSFRVLRELNMTVNHVYSPVTISTGLGILLKGANGETAQQIRRILHFGNVTDSQIHIDLGQVLKYELEAPGEHITVDSANLVLLADEFTPKPDYVKFLKETYGASIVSGNSSTSGQTSIELANKFVQNKTRGLVQKIKNFPADMKLTVVGTNYVKGKWAKPFPRSATKKRPFYNADKTVSQVDTMHIRSTFNVCRIPEIDGRVVEIPMVGQSSVMLLLSDERYGYAEGITWLSETNLEYCVSKMTSGRFDLYLPKVRLDQDVEMTKMLQRLGATNMFNKDLADFTGISSVPGLCVTAFINKMSFELHEGGIEDNSAIGSDNVIDGAIEELRFDHAFGFGILEGRIRPPFVGIVNKL